MSATVFTNAQIFDGSGTPRFLGEVRVEGTKITAVARAGDGGVSKNDATIIDVAGDTLMPGLVDIHTHLGLGSTVDHIAKPGDEADAEAVVTMARCGRTMLEFGYTSAYSAGSFAVRSEIAVRSGFENGALIGPRFRASSFERVPGGPMGLQVQFPGKDVRPSDQASVSQFVEDMADLGVDAVKFLLNGVSAFDPGSNMGEQFYDEEIEAAAVAAHRRGVALTAHCYTAHATKLAVRTGFKMIYHCTYADDDVLDEIEKRKNDIFIGPAPGIVEADLIRAPKFGVMASPEQIDEQTDAVRRIKLVGTAMRERGLRSAPGGDYGFPWNPIGLNARDIELFVEWFGYSPLEALSAATRTAGLSMDISDGIGEIRPGYLADLLVVAGDPTNDLSTLKSRDSFRVIMKDGVMMKSTTKQPALLAV